MATKWRSPNRWRQSLLTWRGLSLVPPAIDARYRASGPECAAPYVVGSTLTRARSARYRGEREDRAMRTLWPAKDPAETFNGDVRLQ
jgi:hypothetical protein